MNENLYHMVPKNSKIKDCMFTAPSGHKSLPLQNFCFSRLLVIFRFLLFLAKESVLHQLVMSFFFIGYPENTKKIVGKICLPWCKNNVCLLYTSDAADDC